MAKVLVDMLQGGHQSFLEELPERRHLTTYHTKELELRELEVSRNYEI